jgi:ferredoxin-thioredoxin reductase catalytic subunit
MDKKTQKLIEEYEEYAKKNGIFLNPDKVFVENLVKRLLANEEKYGRRYCPCRLVSGDEEKDKDKICPCKWSNEEITRQGHCLCNLFVKN